MVLVDGMVQAGGGCGDRDHQDEIVEQFERRRRAMMLVRVAPDDRPED